MDLKRIKNFFRNNKIIYNIWKTEKSIEEYLKIKKLFKNSQGIKRIILIGSPEHDNLGDHAISVAEKKFFDDRLSDFKCIEISGNSYRRAGKHLKNLVSSNDVIAITGGGFIGDVWMEEELFVRNIIEQFLDNKVIVMPQTIFFSDKDGEEIALFTKACTSHKNLYFFCRDKTSYYRAKNDIGIKNLFYIPDMVLYLTPEIKKQNSNYASVCFREDIEASFEEDDKKEILDFIKENGFELEFFSTIYNKPVSFNDREKRLDELFSCIASSAFVVTDRLHAMIFSAITSTPCIAFDNVSGKVSGVYEWIKEQGYIKFAKTKEEFKYLLNDIMLTSDLEFRYNKKSLEEYYNILAEVFTR